ncbi:MAG: glycosyltransferase [Planctomycetaceae bacterium]|nr:glycosyltransferase [Planctomycetaceae bacterium]
MLGWEFPPFISGGLGTACYGLTRAMSRLDLQVLFVLPKAVDAGAPAGGEGARTPHIVAPRRVAFAAVPSAFTNPYQSAPLLAGQTAQPFQACAAMLLEGYSLRIVGTGADGGYEGDLIARIGEYGQRCVEMTRHESFDLIHAHDWVTYPAAQALAAATGKPMVIHVHSTEFDRSGLDVNQPVYEIERRGMHAATAIIAVSNLTKRTCVQHYGVSPEKVRVVHNGIEPAADASADEPRGDGPPTVLFLGRITMQKGPEYFVNAAQRVLEKMNNVRFVVAGWGDMGPAMIQQVAARGLGAHVRFTGFLRGREVQQAYRMSDVYVMPSVSEPFGLTALEAVQHGVPVVLSNNSGAAEVLPRGALKLDYWDIDRMADAVVSLLRYPQLGRELCRHARAEISSLTWDLAAKKCLDVYQAAADDYN